MKPFQYMGRTAGSGAFGVLGVWTVTLCLFVAAADNARGGAATKSSATFPSLKEVRQKWDAQSLEAVQRAAEGSDLTAQHYLGFCYASGDRVLKDGATAVKWYTRAGDAGYLPSLSNLGLLYQRGDGVSRDLAQALKLYHRAADAGWKQAQANIGILYRDGLGVARDPVEALKWFRLAADQGQTVAMVEIGRAYRFGQGVERDSGEAVKWFEKAVAQGEPLAELNLGMIYEGEGNLDKAVKFYRQAAEHGSADAMFMMHNLYEIGTAVGKDIAEAERWLLKGAEAGSLSAQTALGYHHQFPPSETGSRVGGGPASMAEAVKWYRRAAERNWADAQYRLASCYLEGKGVEQDEEHGLDLMRAAADQGHAKALFELSDLYARGVGEPRNRSDEPMQLLQRAVKVKERGSYGVWNPPYDRLIFRCEHGIGTPQDLVAATGWYIRAALDGAFNYSLEDKLDDSLAGSRFDYHLSGPLSKMLADYLKAAQPKGGTNALRIAERFVAGRDVPMSQNRAWVWFNLAAQRGAREGAAKCRAIEQKLPPAELAEARKQYDQLVEHLDAVWQAIRHNVTRPRE